jgi:hypothetical protein
MNTIGDSSSIKHRLDESDVRHAKIAAWVGALNSRLDRNDKRFDCLESAVAENTKITAESAEVTRDIRDALIFARVGTKIIKWLGVLGGAAVAVLTLWTTWKK